MKKCFKTWESMINWARSWESVRSVLNIEKLQGSVLKVEKDGQNLRKYKKVCQNLRKLEKLWECVLNATATANCYLFAVKMLIIFDVQYQSLMWFLGVGGGEGGGAKNRCCQKSKYCVWTQVEKHLPTKNHEVHVKNSVFI